MSAPGTSPASGLPYRAVPRFVARQPILTSSERVLMALVRGPRLRTAVAQDSAWRSDLFLLRPSVVDRRHARDTHAGGVGKSSVDQETRPVLLGGASLRPCINSCLPVNPVTGRLYPSAHLNCIFLRAMCLRPTGCHGVGAAGW